MWESSCHCMGLKLGTQERAADVQLLVIVAKRETFVRAAGELWSFFPSSWGWSQLALGWPSRLRTLALSSSRDLNLRCRLAVADLALAPFDQCVRRTWEMAHWGTLVTTLMPGLCVQETLGFLPNILSWERFCRLSFSLSRPPTVSLSISSHWSLSSSQPAEGTLQITWSYARPVHSVVGQGCHFANSRSHNWKKRKKKSLYGQ